MYHSVKKKLKNYSRILRNCSTGVLLPNETRSFFILEKWKMKPTQFSCEIGKQSKWFRFSKIKIFVTKVYQQHFIWIFDPLLPTVYLQQRSYNTIGISYFWDNKNTSHDERNKSRWVDHGRQEVRSSEIEYRRKFSRFKKRVSRMLRRYRGALVISTAVQKTHLFSI